MNLPSVMRERASSRPPHQIGMIPLSFPDYACGVPERPEAPRHAPDIAAMDLFAVPTIGFKLLYGFFIIRLDRRDLVWINVTTNPTADWIARQITEAFPWNEAPRYMIRDRDRIYGTVDTRRLRAMSIRDKPTAPTSPWQNGFAERLIGSIRRECVDHIIVFGRDAFAPGSNFLCQLLQRL
jgi:hypothetical protein